MQFYKMHLPFPSSARTTFAGGQWVNWQTEENALCPKCKVPGLEAEPVEYHIELNYLGRRGFVEILWNSHVLPMFRTDVIELWRSHHFKAFETRPVKIVGWRDKRRPLPERMPLYYRLIAKGRATLASPSVYMCPDCGFREYDFDGHTGIRIDESSWDGSDIFSLYGYNFIFCTRNVVQVTLQAGYKHIVFIPMEEWKT